MIIAEMIIPKMFTAYAEDLGYQKHNGLHHYQYYCNNCDQLFSAAWGRAVNMGYAERGSLFACPCCGRPHEKHVAFVKRNIAAPDKVRLVVKEYKSAVTLEFSCKAVVFYDYLGLQGATHREVFRFDIAKQEATLSVTHAGIKHEPVEIGSPFNLALFQSSMLSIFSSRSIPNTEQKSKLTKVLKILRDTVHQKLEKHLGHKIKSMFVSPGTHWGMFLFPLFNMAYRVACTDAPNLPECYRDEHKAVFAFWNTKYFDELEGGQLMEDVILNTRGGMDFISALVELSGLPDKPRVRRILAENPFEANILKLAFSTCCNYDHATQLYRGITANRKFRADSWNGGELNSVSYDGLAEFLWEMKEIYGEAGIVRLVNEAKELHTRDCIRLYEQLNDENKEAVVGEGIRLRDLHDWMSLRHKKQGHKNLKFDVPEHIVRRLSMQHDRLRFFLPAESMELVEAGHQLHNCVASYSDSMKQHDSWIVLVADDKGKLVACLELVGSGNPPNVTRVLVQAKIDRNQCISKDKKLNAAVLAWAKDAGIEIKTKDVNVPNKKNNELEVAV